MRRLKLRYGDSTITLSVPETRLAGVYRPRRIPALRNFGRHTLSALRNPLGAKRLEEVASQKKTVAILIDDLTRSIPTDKILDVFIPYLVTIGFDIGKITVICAVGAHRALTKPELERLAGKCGSQLRLVNHDPDAQSDLVPLGVTSLGTEIKINRLFYESDVKLVVCDTEYHQFCGYGGGAKSILPGISDRKSIEACHSRFEASGSEPGRIKGNQVREEIEEAGRMAQVDLIVNVVVNDKKEIVRIFAGDIYEAFLAGTRVVDEMYKISVPERVETLIVSAGGYPKDINLYQAQKAIASAARIVRERGRVVLFAECREGIGSELFLEWMVNEKDLDTIIQKIRQNFILGAHKAYQFARDLKWADVYVYSKIEEELIRQCHMRPLRKIDEIAEIISDSQSIVVLPHATTTLATIGSVREHSLKEVGE